MPATKADKPLALMNSNPALKSPSTKMDANGNKRSSIDLFLSQMFKPKSAAIPAKALHFIELLDSTESSDNVEFCSEAEPRSVLVKEEKNEQARENDDKMASSSDVLFIGGE